MTREPLKAEVTLAYHIGDTVWAVRTVESDTYSEPCWICGGQGTVLIRENDFTCPNCCGDGEVENSTERIIVEGPLRVKEAYARITFTDRASMSAYKGYIAAQEGRTPACNYSEVDLFSSQRLAAREARRRRVAIEQAMLEAKRLNEERKEK